MDETGVRTALMGLLEPRFSDAGIDPQGLDGSSSLIEQGVVDSFFLVELLVNLQAEIGAEIDFMELNVDDFASVDGIMRVALSALAG